MPKLGFHMAIFYYSDFSRVHSSSNFGDDINPFLLEKLLTPSLIVRDDVCVMGIGTLINDENINALRRFARKLIFSSGVGYGSFTSELDASWDVICVRGPKTAETLGLEPEKAVCDGAVLLSNYFDVIPDSKRQTSVIFIPHIKTHWAAGEELRKVAKRVGMTYLPPDLPANDFINRVANAKLVVTEAMHGAILADTMRVPWIPVGLHEHNRFKWADWMSSIGVDYHCNSISPSIWNSPKDSFRKFAKSPLQKIKIKLLSQRLSDIIVKKTASLSSDELLENRKRQLLEKVDYMNSKYGSA